MSSFIADSVPFFQALFDFMKPFIEIAKGASKLLGFIK
ncbi:Uncharacterised protein [Corynebacterium kutscheri]|uniref:Uncharacterized protein n=1 Tax=Corynebacterium kutscheri TaxID=35755 RepID=A0AB38VQL2_9CORY|nr:Uncharacterised protein [Corynebacterium kutscheri]VEH11126.1 Uncharacterised protein [Corynebacterium kutscheri]VEH80397.1 Uncharacterised protein [Corynebacterium kutscheri]